MIEITDLTKTFQTGETKVQALRGVTCGIPAGSFTFVVGPSGSGKSTLLYLIGALDTPTSGQVVVEGQSLAGLTGRDADHYRRHQVGFVFQSFNLLKNLNALDNVLVPFFPEGISDGLRRRAAELLQAVGLGERKHHRPAQLSGGEQQRVAIARALLKQPMLVLADEPTGELDSQTGAEVFGYLRQLHQDQQTTVIVVTHDERYIRDADHVLRLRDGQLAGAADPE